MTKKYEQENQYILNSIDPQGYNVNQSMDVKIRVTNVGKRDGDEVVQLYVSLMNKQHKTPIRALKGFRRIFLKSGESQVVTFRLRPSDLAMLDAHGSLRFEPGRVAIAIGGGLDLKPSAVNKNIVETIIELTN